MQDDYGKKAWAKMSDEDQWRAVADFLNNYFSTLKQNKSNEESRQAKDI